MTKINLNKGKNRTFKLSSTELKNYIKNLNYNDFESAKLADFLDLKNKDKDYIINTNKISFIDYKNLNIYTLTDKSFIDCIFENKIDETIKNTSKELNFDYIVESNTDIKIFKTDLLPTSEYSSYFYCGYKDNKYITYNLECFLDGFYIDNNIIKFGAMISKIKNVDLDYESQLKKYFQKSCIFAHNHNFKIDFTNLTEEQIKLFNEVKELENLR